MYQILSFLCLAGQVGGQIEREVGEMTANEAAAREVETWYSPRRVEKGSIEGRESLIQHEKAMMHIARRKRQSRVCYSCDLKMAVRTVFAYVSQWQTIPLLAG
jgi:hypothetical protein